MNPYPFPVFAYFMGGENLSSVLSSQGGKSHGDEILNPVRKGWQWSLRHVIRNPLC